MTEKFLSFESIRFLADRYKEVDQTAVEAFWAMLRVATQLTIQSESYFQKLGCSHSRFKVMMCLFMRGSETGCAPAALAEFLNVKRATITGVLDTLESDGWIERLPDPEDRRGLIVRLTQAGCDWLDQLLPGHYARMAKAMGDFSEIERRDLVQLLDKFEGGMRKLYGDSKDKDKDTGP